MRLQDFKRITTDRLSAEQTSVHKATRLGPVVRQVHVLSNDSLIE